MTSTWVMAFTALLAAAPAPVRVGSKDFAESRLLGELFAQAIEARGVPVERRLGLSGSSVAFDALRSDALDVYPEYSGTAFLVLLHEAAPPAAAAERTLGTKLAALDLLWLPSLGFSNGWVLAVRQELAAHQKIATLTDLARSAPSLRAGFSPEFLDRSDGLPGLAGSYGLHFRTSVPLAQPLKYAALGSDEIDVIDAYATDGRLASPALTALADDRGAFPAYEAAPLARADLASRAPAALEALLSLRGRLDEGAMRRLNDRVERGEAPADVARGWLASQALGGEATVAPSTAARPSEGLLAFFWHQRAELWRLLRRHLALTIGALAIASLLGFPLGFAAARSRFAARLTLPAVGVLQTLPGLALLAFLVPWFGIGAWPALVALCLYALLPIVAATHAGLTAVDPELVEVARGLGMTDWQITRRLRAPLAAPIALSGLRTAAVIAVGTAVLAAFVGGGGLGEPILAGLTLNDTRLILLGALPSAVLAILFDLALAALARLATPRQ